MTEAEAMRLLVARLRDAGCVFAEEEAALLTEAAVDPADRADPAHPARPVDPGTLEGLVRRRVAGEPLEQVVGWASFAGVRVAVAPGVFVPRRRTELMVAVAAGLDGPGRAEGRPVVLDLCCGTGALGVALLARAAGLLGQLAEEHRDPIGMDVYLSVDRNAVYVPRAERA